MIGPKVFDAIMGAAYGDPGFYAAKKRLREAFPSAAMIELAEGSVTVVMNGRTHQVFL